jgi:hypothetical protein
MQTTRSGDPESTRVLVHLAGPDGSSTCECIVQHYGHVVTDVRFPAAWRALCDDVGLDAFEVDTEALLSSLAETAFARLHLACA